jgi:hypothetical protein
MANYTEFVLKKPTAEALGKKVRSLFADAPYSVEVLRDGNDVTFRVWLSAPYDLGDHTEL